MSPRRPPAPDVPGPRPSNTGSGRTPVTSRARPVTAASARARPRSAPASRPGASTRPRAGSAGRADGARGGTRAGTGRPLWVLGGVGVVLALLILPYFQKWLVQRSEIESARAAVSQSQQDVAALTAQRARWADDEYVKAQARARLNYVMPGETGFVVVDPKPKPRTGDPARKPADVPQGQRPWFADVWLSAQVAADPAGTSKR
jgi:Septum formation initiator